MRSNPFSRFVVALFGWLMVSVPLSADSYRVTIRTQGCTRQQVLEATPSMPVTLVAEPQQGATFLGWSDGATANPYTLTVSSDTTLTPLFAEATPKVEYRLTLYTDSCDTPTTLPVAHGSAVTLVAQPQNGYLFSRWDDGNTDNPRLVTVVADATYRAVFKENPASGDGSTTPLPTHTITILSDRCAAPKTLQVTEGKHITLYATADDCGRFSQWSDGNTDNPRTVEVTADATYTAEFARQQYTLTATPDDAAHGAITITIE